jgi:microfibrillar-associated protein 1
MGGGSVDTAQGQCTVQTKKKKCRDGDPEHALEGGRKLKMKMKMKMRRRAMCRPSLWKKRKRRKRMRTGSQQDEQLFATSSENEQPRMRRRRWLGKKRTKRGEGSSSEYETDTDEDEEGESRQPLFRRSLSQRSRETQCKRGKKFMQKYHHKGAFYMDDDSIKTDSDVLRCGGG